MKLYSFKPCYKWNTFNTASEIARIYLAVKVLNLVISGIPSILLKDIKDLMKSKEF